MLLDKIRENMLVNKDKIYYDETELITYGKLNKYIVNLYNYLLKIKKEDKENRIVIYGHKSIYMIISMLACSYAGITYIPVDQILGNERIKEIIDISDPLCVINTTTTKIYENEIGIEEIKSIVNINSNSVNELVPLIKPENIYYIIFTSGSTGKPKGVKVTYKNIDTFTENIVKVINVNQTVVLNQALFSFDLSVADIYITLLTSSKYVMLTSQDIDDYPKMYKKIMNNNVEVIISTPSFIEYLLIDTSFNKINFKLLKYVYLCGEVLQGSTVKKIFERFGDINIINAYGPTECTVAVTNIYINNSMVNIPIGKEIDNTFCIVDNNLNILPEGKTGNILIYGNLVSNGYIYGNSSKFIYFKGEKAYLSGDLGYIKDGNLYYISRIDRQVKYNGYRIELGDIENKIMTLDSVLRCVVVPKRDNHGKITKLIAYVVSNKSKDVLKNKIRNIVPKYMLPDIKVVENLPTNNNYKIDVKRIEEYENEKENN